MDRNHLESEHAGQQQVPLTADAAFGQPTVDLDKKRCFLEAPGQVPYPIQRDRLQHDHIGADLPQDLDDAPGAKRPSRLTQSLRLSHPVLSAGAQPAFGEQRETGQTEARRRGNGQVFPGRSLTSAQRVP